MQALINNLPPESATKTALRDSLSSDEWESMPDPEGWGPWSRTDELLASLTDRLSWVTFAIYHAQGGKPSEPEPMDRPGVGKPPWERMIDRRRSRAYLAYLQSHQGSSPPPEWDPDAPQEAGGDENFENQILERRVRAYAKYVSDHGGDEPPPGWDPDTY